MEPNDEQNGRYNKALAFRSGPVSHNAAPSRQPNQNRHYAALGFTQGPVAFGHGNRYENVEDLTIPSAYFSGPSALSPTLQELSITGSQDKRLPPMQNRTTPGESSNSRTDPLSRADDRAGIFEYIDRHPTLMEDVEMEIEISTRRQKGKAPIYTEDETLEDAPQASVEPPQTEPSPQTSAEPSSTDNASNTPGTSGTRAGSGVQVPRRTTKAKYFRRTSKKAHLKKRPKKRIPFEFRDLTTVEEEWEEKEYPCPYEDCDLICHSQEDIDQHVAEAHRELFNCQVCKNVYATVAGRDAHQDKHSKVLQCSVPGCPFMSVTRVKMIKHMQEDHPEEFAKLKFKSTWDEGDRLLCRNRKVADE